MTPVVQEATAAPQAGAGCAGCALAPGRAGALQRMGVAVAGYDHVVALLGNPNTGKSTVFNALTGLRQHVGNWTGKTVSRAEGAFRLGGKMYKLVDLPGCYSLSASSHHEEIARDFILFGDPHAVVVVVDATRLERNLMLVLQVLEITDRVVVALNLVDEAKRHGLTIDVRALERRLGVRVVPTVARRGTGIPELLAALQALLAGEFVPDPPDLRHASAALEEQLAEIQAGVEELYPGLPNARWVALRLLEGDASIVEALREGTLGQVERMEDNAMPSLSAAKLDEDF